MLFCNEKFFNKKLFIYIYKRKNEIKIFLFKIIYKNIKI